MISCSSGCKHMSISVFFSSWMRWTWSVTICRRSVIFWSSLANSCRESGWLSFSCSSNECSTVSWSCSMGFTFRRPGRSGQVTETGKLNQWHFWDIFWIYNRKERWKYQTFPLVDWAVPECSTYLHYCYLKKKKLLIFISSFYLNHLS